MTSCSVASKPGTYVQMLSVRLPPEDPRLREDLALLADCALPPELRRSPALRRLSPACSLWPSKVWTRAEHVVSSNTEYNYLTHSLCGWEGTGAPRGSL